MKLGRTAPAAQPPAIRTFDPRWPGLFLGAVPDGPLCIGPEHAALVLGPPRSGKTTAIVVPNILLAPGAVVSTSTKTDVAAWTRQSRASRGRTWIYDPSGRLDPPDSLTPLRWSPIPGSQDWGEAVSTAHAMAGAASRHARRNSDADHWIERAEALLAPLFHAAGLAGRDISAVLRWVLRRDVTEPAELIVHHHGHEIAAETLAGIVGTDERERSGIFSTAAGLLTAYRTPAALANAQQPNFDPHAFVRSSDTLYICAPADDQDQLAPLVVALLDRIKQATYRRERGWPPVFWALDEVANIAPLPSLPQIVSEGAGQGLVVLACLQDLSQARSRWGPAADGFLTLFGWKTLLAGIADLDTLRLVSALGGDHYVRMRSETNPASVLAALSGKSVPTVTDHWDRQPALPVDHINRLPPGTALAIGPRTGPMPIRLVACWQWDFA